MSQTLFLSSPHADRYQFPLILQLAVSAHFLPMSADIALNFQTRQRDDDHESEDTRNNIDDISDDHEGNNDDIDNDESEKTRDKEDDISDDHEGNNDDIDNDNHESGDTRDNDDDISAD